MRDSVAEPEDTSQLESETVRDKRSRFSPASLAIIVILSILTVGGGFVAHKQGVFSNGLPRSKAATSENYRNKVELAFRLLIQHSALAEAVCKAHVQSWKAATEESYGNINLAISMSISEQFHQIEDLKDGKRLIENAIKKLHGPPESFAIVYTTIVKFYGELDKLRDLAISPSGSLISYAQSVRRQQDAIVALIRELQVMIPD